MISTSSIPENRNVHQHTLHASAFRARRVSVRRAESER